MNGEFRMANGEWGGVRLAGRRPTSRRPLLCLLICALSVCPRVLGLELEVTGLDGKTICGRLVQVMPEIILTTADGEAVLSWSEILAARPLPADVAADPHVGRPPEHAPLRFELADGSVLDGRIDVATDRSFTVVLPSGESGRLEPTLLRTVRSTMASYRARVKLAEVTAEEDRSEDVAIVERGPKVVVLRGAVRRIDSDRVVFAWKERELQLPWERLAGLSFARPLPRRSVCTVRMRGGNVFTGRVAAGDETSLTLRSEVFDDLVLSWPRIERIECRSRRLTYLSDLVPERYGFTPFFEKQWDYAYDRTLTGRPIRLAGLRYDRGVTMHSRSSLAYTLRGQYRQFAAVVGIVDEMEGRGDVTLAILGDGRILWEATNVRGGEEPRAVLVDVTGVRELSLHVDFGEALDLSDQVCWALARLIR